MVLQPLWPLAAFSFLIYIVSRNPWTGDQLPTHRATQTQNKRRQTSMPRVGFESMTPVFERAKTVYTLHRAATVIGLPLFTLCKYINTCKETQYTARLIH
jgi:hypothetical protein